MSMLSKRTLLVGLGGLICSPGVAFAQAVLPPIPKERHEQAMRLAIERGDRAREHRRADGERRK
jgi:hypothetical protein